MLTPVVSTIKIVTIARYIFTPMQCFVFQVQQQQYPQLEGWASGGDARALMMKLLTTAITFVQILFVVAGLLINTVTPFVRTPARLTVTALAVAFVACYYYKQDDILVLVNKLKARTNFGKNS